MTPDPVYGEAGRLEHRLDRAVLAERPVERDEDERRAASAPASRSIAAPARQRAVGAERRRVVVGGRGRPLAAMVGRQPPPAAVEVDQDLADVVAAADEGLGDRRAGHDRDVVLGRWAAEEDDDRRMRGVARGHRPIAPIAEEHDLGLERGRPVAARTAAAHLVGQARGRRRRCPSGR